MWDDWCADGLYGYDAGTIPSFAENSHAFYATPASAGDDGLSADDFWGLTATAIAGIVAYEGVRRVIARSRAHERPSTPTTQGRRPRLPQSEDARVVAALPEASASPSEPDPVVGVSATGLLSEPREGSAADLVDELIALYDLEPNDALKRRIVRSLAKAGVHLDDARAIPFDSERHDVVGTLAAEPGTAPGTVVDVIRPGFAHHDGQVVRAAEVVVATDADGAW